MDVQKMDPETELIYKRIGHKRYTKLVEDMKEIAEKFKQRNQKYKAVVGQPLTPSTEVRLLK